MAEQKPTDLIIPNTHDLVATKVQSWKQRREDEAKEKKVQALAAKKGKADAKKLALQQKQEALIRETKDYFVKSFIALCKKHLGVKYDRELEKMSDEELRVLDDLLAKEMVKPAWTQTIGYLLFLSLPIVTIKLGLIMNGVMAGLVGILGTFVAMFFAVAALEVLFRARGQSGRDESWEDCTERKYLWVYRKSLKKLYGENYFPIKEFKQRFEYE